MSPLIRRASTIYQISLVLLVLCRAPMLRVSSYMGVLGQKTMSQVWKVVAPTLVSVGPINAQTEPSSEIELDLAPGFDDTSGRVGEFMDIRVYASDLEPQAYTVNGVLPPGIEYRGINQFGVAEFSGVPTEAGTWHVNVAGWENEEFVEPGSGFFRISFRIQASVPVINQQPVNQELNWGELLSLSVKVVDEEGVNYQWYQNTEPIDGQVSDTLQINMASVIHAGSYYVTASNEFGQISSEEVVVKVVADDFERWREAAFEDPFDSLGDPFADPDLDNLSNATEFVLGSDPLSGSTNGYPKVSYERFEETTYIVLEYRRNPFDPNLPHLLEMKTHLGAVDWIPVDITNASIFTEAGEGFYRAKIPVNGPAFFRLRTRDKISPTDLRSLVGAGCNSIRHEIHFG